MLNELEVMHFEREYRPDALINRLRMWLAQKIDIGPGDGSWWCLDCNVNGGKTFVQHTNDLKAIQDHVRLHDPDDRCRIRSAVPVKKE